MKQLRDFEFRFYPTDSQRLELAQTFGCTRFVYNWALALRTNSYYQDKISLSYTDTSNALTKLKKDLEKPWLEAVSAVPLQQGLRHLNTAFQNFFKGRTKYPRFKKKANRQSANYVPNAFKWELGKLTLAKISQPLRIKWSRYFTGEPKSVTLAVKNTMANHKLAKAQGYAPRASLDATACFAGSADRGWGEFLRQLEYKAKWHDRKIGAINLWFPSTKRCHSWGHRLDKLSLNIRERTCPSCNFINLRDRNAAENIKAVCPTVFFKIPRRLTAPSLLGMLELIVD